MCNQGEELLIFQSLLKEIPKWSNTILLKEVNRIKQVSNCNYLELLLKDVINSNIISIININININIDEFKDYYNFEKFIHTCYITVAKDLYQEPQLLYHDNKKLCLKKNQLLILDLIKKSLLKSIRKSLPIEYIIEKYLNGKEDEISRQIGGGDDNIKSNINSSRKFSTNTSTNSYITLSNNSNRTLSNNSNRTLSNNSNRTLSNNSNRTLSNNSNIKASLVSSEHIQNYSLDTNNIINNLKEDNEVLSTISNNNINSIKDNSRIINNNNLDINLEKINYNINETNIGNKVNNNISNNNNNNNNTINTINNLDTSISYNEQNDNNYLTVFSN